MKNPIKCKAMLRIAGVIVLAAIIMFSMTACDGENAESTDNFEFIAGGGDVKIRYAGGDPMTVKVATNLPHPNHKFTLKAIGDEITLKDLIPDMSVVVKFTYPGSASIITVSAATNTINFSPRKNF